MLAQNQFSLLGGPSTSLVLSLSVATPLTNTNITTIMSTNLLTVDHARTRRKSSTIMSGRKLSTDVSRKLSAISTAPDVSAISDKLGMEQGTLKTIVKDILDMDSRNKWEVTSEDEASDYEEEGWETDEQIYEIVRLEQRKKDSTGSQVTPGWVSSLNCQLSFSLLQASNASTEDPLDINMEEINAVINMYRRHQISVTSFVAHEGKFR